MALIHGPNNPGFYAILLFTVLDYTSITSHTHNWVLFLLWLHRFILSGVISPPLSSSILGTYWPWEFIFQSPFCLFILFMGFSRQEYGSGLPLQWTTFYQTSPPWPHHLGWTHTAWLSFIELDKAVVHTIRLACCLWLQFQSFCPLMPSLSTCRLTWVSLTLDLGSSKVQPQLLTLAVEYLL